MKQILGLDIGVNSIGWAFINEDDNGILQSIEAIGSRIIPEGQEHKDFELGKKISKNAQRRVYRGARRLNYRYKQRRNNIIKICKILGIVPKGLEKLFEKIEISGKNIIIPENVFSKNDKQLDEFEIYRLRAKALNEMISLEELFRIVYHQNQRRGFKSNRKANNLNENEDNNKENINDESSRNKIISFEDVKIVSVEETGEKIKNKTEYLITLEDGRKSKSQKFQFKNYIGSKKILKITKEILKNSDEPKYTFSLASNWQVGRKELNDMILKSGGYPGKYFYEEYLKSIESGNSINFRVKNNIVNRELYLNEFKKIWETQEKLYQKENIDINRIENYEKAISEIIPDNNIIEKQIWIKKGLGEFIRDYIIFYQRGLKSQIKSIGECQFEERIIKITDTSTGEIIEKKIGVKCCPKSHPMFQEFRIWQQIHNLNCKDQNNETIILTDVQKLNLFRYLNGRKVASKKDIEKLLKKQNPDIYLTNLIEGINWCGNKTLYLFKSLFKKYNCENSLIFHDYEKYLRLWHLIYSVEEEKGVETGLKKLDNTLDKELIEELKYLKFEEQQYSSLSLKAIKNLLQLMRIPEDSEQNNLNEKVENRIKDFLSGENQEEFDANTLLKLNEYKSKDKFYGLSYYEAASLIYGKHSAKQLDKYTRYDDIKAIPRNSLRNPVVEQIVNETLMLVRDLWEKYPNLNNGEIRVELARELKSNIEEREKITKSQINRQKINIQISEEIKRQKGDNYVPSLSDIEKVKIWHEAGERSVYTGKSLSISDVLSANTEIDHIIPRSRYYDNSLNNKVICESEINHDKGNMTSFEYMHNSSRCEKLPYEQFLALIMNLRIPYSKRKILTMKEIPDDFINRQIKDTQYISKRVKEELGKIVGVENVKTSTGMVTDYLKDIWGVGELMKKLIEPRFQTLQNRFNIPLIEVVDELDTNDNPTGKKVTRIKGYSKRYDHRNHALDALIVACTKQKIIQQLNLLNKINNGEIKSFVLTVNGSNRKFIPPTGINDKNANIFYDLAKNALNNIIVSYKTNHRFITKGNNWYNKYNSNLRRIVKEKQNNNDDKDIPWAIKRKLHNETKYGIILYDNQYRYVSKCKLINLTENKLKNIADKKIKEEIINHVNKPEYNGHFEKAFNEDGLIEFNEKRKVHIYSVRVMEDGVADKVKGKVPLYTEERKLFVEKEGNLCVSVYEHRESKQRKFDIVSVYDAVNLKAIGENPFQTGKGKKYEQDGYKLLFTLSHYDLVFVPDDEIDISNIDWSDKKYLFNKIYRVVKFSNESTIYFQPHYFAKEIKLNESKATNSRDYKGEFSFNTNGTQYYNTDKLIRNVCYKIYLDRLGNVKI
jgi:CRISPR subtype II RNA-guided endonuclease Cas9/Csn1